MKQLNLGNVDLAFISPPFDEGDGEVVFCDLEPDELLITFPRQHPLAKRKSVSLPELESSELVLMKEAHSLRNQSLSFLEQAGIESRVRIENSQLDTMVSMVEAGLGLSFTPRMAVASLRHRKVTFVSVVPKPLYRRIAIGRLKRQPLSRVQNAFLEVVRARR